MAILKATIFFINTTHFDNTPVSIIVHGVGVAIVSTNVGGISYLLEDKKTALLVNDNDADAMVNAIKMIIADNALKEDLVNNALHLVRGFDWEKVKSKWHEVLK